MFSYQTGKELQSGNPEVFKQIYLLMYPRLKGYCRLFIHDNNQVEDIIQETFLVLWSKKDLIDNDKNVENLIFIMVRNRCLNFLREKRMDSLQSLQKNNSINELQYLYQLDFTNSEELSLEEMLIESLKNAVSELPDRMRMVFTLCKIEGKKQKEVADELQISIKMVEKQIAKSKEKIRKKLEKSYPELIFFIALLLN